MSGEGHDAGGAPPALAEHVTRHCLACGSSEVVPAMVIFARGALPGTPEHDFAYEHDVVVACGPCGALRLETWRHDCFDFDDWFDRHWYFPLAEGAAPRLRRAMEACPAPMSPGCDCAGHRSLVDSLDGLPPRSLEAERGVGVRAPVRVVEGSTGPRFDPGPGR